MAAAGPQPPPPSTAPLAPDSQQTTGLARIWRSRGPAAWALWPLSLAYRALVALRRGLYRLRVLHSAHPGPPVIVVGNVIAGGAGKTPVVIALVRHLQAQGWQPGVISRITAARALLAAHPGTNVLVCDDGLQHLALARDLEICVFNSDGVGNGFLLPAGPLREPWPRQVDWVLHAGTRPTGHASSFALQRRLAPHALRADGRQVPLKSLREGALHAVAAVARPKEFFAMLQAQGLQLAGAEALPDHYDFNSWQRPTNKGIMLICTEKDAVKLWPLHPDALAVPLALEVDPAFFAALDARLAPWRATPLSSPSA
jgi:tetraacyldisaccharide 4'-kinase